MNESTAQRQQLDVLQRQQPTPRSAATSPPRRGVSPLRSAGGHPMPPPQQPVTAAMQPSESGVLSAGGASAATSSGGGGASRSGGYSAQPAPASPSYDDAVRGAKTGVVECVARRVLFAVCLPRANLTSPTRQPVKHTHASRSQVLL